LVPYVAKPFYLIARGRVATWDPVFFGLLVANSIFCAWSATLLVSVAARWKVKPAVALLAGCLYLMNYTIPNAHLAGLVDSAEGWTIMGTVWALTGSSWFMLPGLGVAAALGKETAVLIGGTMLITWWCVAAKEDGRAMGRLCWVAAYWAAGLATVLLVRSAVDGQWVWLGDIVRAERSSHNIVIGLKDCLLARGCWYPFCWLLPLGLWRLRSLPRPWVLGSVVACCAVLAMGAWNNAGGNVGRPLFNALGPVLTLSAALTIIGSDVAPARSRGYRQETGGRLAWEEDKPSCPQ